MSDGEEEQLMKGGLSRMLQRWQQELSLAGTSERLCRTQIRVLAAELRGECAGGSVLSTYGEK